MDQGWIKLSRKLIDWEWYDNQNVFRLFIHCLLKANHKDKKWRGILIKTGSFITSYDILSKETGLSLQSIRTSLKKLKSTQEITIKTTNLNTCISINKWQEYQAINNQNNNQVTNKQQTNNNQSTTTKNVKNDNNVNKIYGLYPSKCPIQNRSTSKGSKDKEKIKKLLSNISEDKLILTIKTYIAECEKSKTYVKNFSSFLNNLPEIPEEPVKEKRYSYKIHFTGYDNRTEKQYQEDLKQFGEALILR